MGSKTDKSVPAIAQIPIPKISSRRADIRGAIELERAGLLNFCNMTLSGGCGTRTDLAVPFGLVEEMGAVEPTPPAIVSGGCSL